VEAFLTAKNNVLYAIVPRRPAKEIELADLQATGDVRVTLLETDQTIDSHRSGKQVSMRFRIRLPERCQRARRTYCGLKGVS